MGIMLTQYPQLFGALVCSVPLLDMRRFQHPALEIFRGEGSALSQAA